MAEEIEHKQYVSVNTYAKLCGTTPHAIYQRIYRSQDGEYERGQLTFLEVCTLKEVEGLFIDTQKYPPVKKITKKR